MSKKKKAATRHRKTNGSAGRARSKPARRSARSQALPGFDQVRNQRLDNICESIGDERETMNKAKQEEQGLIGSALETMRRANVTIYKHAGIELARVPGAEKLRVRVVKDQGDATVETGAESSENLETEVHGDELES